MRRVILAAAALFGLAAAPALAAPSPEGVWLVQDKDAKVRIAPCQGRADRLCGEIVWLQTPRAEDGRPKSDEHNPDPKLRNRPIMGLVMIRDFRAAGPGRWEDGKIYDPHTGKTYASKMHLNDEGVLKVDGCVLVICKSQTWRRAS